MGRQRDGLAVELARIGAPAEQVDAVDGADRGDRQLGHHQQLVGVAGPFVGGDRGDIDLARQQYSAREVWVSCFNHNTAGLLLYPQLGFTPFGIEERQAWDGTRVALVQMKQILT